MESISKLFSYSEIADLHVLETRMQRSISNYSRHSKDIIHFFLDMLDTADKKSNIAIHGLYLSCFGTQSPPRIILEQIDPLLELNFDHIKTIYSFGGLPLVLNYIPKMHRDIAKNFEK